MKREIKDGSFRAQIVEGVLIVDALKDGNWYECSHVLELDTLTPFKLIELVDDCLLDLSNRMK